MNNFFLLFFFVKRERYCMVKTKTVSPLLDILNNELTVHPNIRNNDTW